MDPRLYPDRPVVLAVEGLDGSHKTEAMAQLADLIESATNVKPATISLPTRLAMDAAIRTGAVSADLPLPSQIQLIDERHLQPERMAIRDTILAHVYFAGRCVILDYYSVSALARTRRRFELKRAQGGPAVPAAGYDEYAIKERSILAPDVTIIVKNSPSDINTLATPRFCSTQFNRGYLRHLIPIAQCLPVCSGQFNAQPHFVVLNIHNDQHVPDLTDSGDIRELQAKQFKTTKPLVTWGGELISVPVFLSSQFCS